MTTTTLTRKHQITLPAEIVQALELAPGSQVEWAIGPDGTLIGTLKASRAQRARRCTALDAGIYALWNKTDRLC